jgi:hypothetical protein
VDPQNRVDLAPQWVLTCSMGTNRTQNKQKPLPPLGFSIKDLWSGVNLSNVVQKQVERFNVSGKLEERGAPSEE